MILADACVRISCGVATGADQVFVRPENELSADLRPFARPTIAGRELVPGSRELTRSDVMLMPYDEYGRLLPEEELGALGQYLRRDDVRRRLVARTCAQRKPWYAFHDALVLQEILRPKILFKDIGATPHFWVDWIGDIVPRPFARRANPSPSTSLRGALRNGWTFRHPLGGHASSIWWSLSQTAITASRTWHICVCASKTSR